MNILFVLHIETEKIQIKCRIMWQFIRVYTVCYDKNDLKGKLQFCLKIKTCDPLNYTMDHSKFIASIQKEEFISSFKSSANYYIQQQILNYMYMMKHQIL